MTAGRNSILGSSDFRLPKRGAMGNAAIDGSIFISISGEIERAIASSKEMSKTVTEVRFTVTRITLREPVTRRELA